MTTETKTCIVCKQNSRQVPLLAVEYQDRQYWICPQHLPILIHNPQELTGVLPGADKLQGHEH